MKSLLISISIIISSSIFASNVELKISTLFKKGESTTKMKDVKIIAKMGQEFEVPATDGSPFNLKLNVTHFNKNMNKDIDVNMDNLVMIKGNVSVLENGNMKRVSSPTIVTKIGNEATISSENEDGFFEMKVIAVKTTHKM
jgi:hypothetical protein